MSNNKLDSQNFVISNQFYKLIKNVMLAFLIKHRINLFSRPSVLENISNWQGKACQKQLIVCEKNLKEVYLHSWDLQLQDLYCLVNSPTIGYN